MSASDEALGRRRLLVLLGAAAAGIPACSDAGLPLGGPYGGTENNVPPPTPGSRGGGDDGGNGSGNDSGGGNEGDGGNDGDSRSGGMSGTDGRCGSGSSGGSSGGGSDAGSSSGASEGGLPACTAGSSTLPLPFSQYPQLREPGGSVLIYSSSYSDPACGMSGVIVVRTSAGEYSALSSSCTHACCTVCFDGKELHCPCHGANFDVTTGQCTNGRASEALQVLQTCFDSAGVYVTL